jgi:NADP-dependent 3-hydroxy acid dehydrogenase YdfG
MNSLQGKVALVTGASSGIGRSIALALAKEGVQLCLVGRNQQRLEAVKNLAQDHGNKAIAYSKDLTLDQDISQLKVDFNGDFEGLDILVHSAGIINLGKLQECSVDSLDEQYRTNVRAPYLLTQTLLPELCHSRGDIVFINSTAIMQAKPQGGQYAATKSALKAIADSLRQEINPQGVRVLSIYAGRTATSLQHRLYQAEDRSYQPEKLVQPEDVAAVTINALQLPRTAEVVDLHIRPATN